MLDLWRKFLVANTEVDLINLDAEYFSNLSKTEVFVCIVLNVCNDLNRYVESF